MKLAWRVAALIFALFLMLGAAVSSDYSAAIMLAFIAGALFENLLRLSR